MRRYFTLLELLVTLVLTAALCSGLLGYYTKSAALHQQAGQAVWPVQLAYTLQQRLDQILPEVTSLKEEGFFYTHATTDELGQNSQARSLVFAYNNGIDPEPEFSAEVLAKLWLDLEGRLLLSLWPSPSHWKLPSPPERTEVLCDNISELHWAFFYPDDSEEEDIHKPPQGWSSIWLKDYQDIPSLVRLTIVSTHFAKPLTWTYELYAGHPIRYRQEAK